MLELGQVKNRKVQPGMLEGLLWPYEVLAGQAVRGIHHWKLYKSTKQLMTAFFVTDSDKRTVTTEILYLWCFHWLE